mgnify:CR=1 FL=1
MIDKASEKIANLQEQYGDGLLTPDERYKRAVDIGTEVSDDKIGRASWRERV